MSPVSPGADDGGRRRALIVGGLAALVLAVGGGASFALLSAGDQPDPDDLAQEQRTQRAVASLPTPAAEPAPIDAHFPSVADLRSEPVADELVAGLEDRLRPPEDGFAATRHRSLRRDDQRVALISLLRAGDADSAQRLRRDALTGVGELFDSVVADEVAGEAVMRGKTTDGTALLWLPDTDSVLVVSALSRQRAETVLTAIVASVRGPAAVPGPATPSGSPSPRVDDASPAGGEAGSSP
jgi:hypothetical protein